MCIFWKCFRNQEIKTYSRNASTKQDLPSINTSSSSDGTGPLNSGNKKLDKRFAIPLYHQISTKSEGTGKTKAAAVELGAVECNEQSLPDVDKIPHIPEPSSFSPFNLIIPILES